MDDPRNQSNVPHNIKIEIVVQRRIPSWRLCFVDLDYLVQAFDAGDLQFFSSLEPLRARNAFLRHIAPTRKKDWVVYAKRPFAGPEEVLKYVAHRVAIANDRWLDIDDSMVQFRWKGYRDSNRHKNVWC